MIGDRVTYDEAVEVLGSDDEPLPAWAVRGLQKLDTRQARQEPWRARANGLIG
jgi:hypothetical protein